MTSTTATARLDRPTFWQYGWQTVGFGVLYVAVVYCAAFIGFAQVGPSLLIAVVAAAVVLVGLVIGYLIAVNIGRRRLRQLRDAAPGAFVFRFSSTVGFGNLFADPTTRRPLESSLGKGFGASADASGITIWYGNTPVTVASLGWKSVTELKTDRVTTGGLKYASVMISYLADDGTTKALQLVKADAEPLPVRSKVEVDWITGELNALRAS